MNDLIRPGIGGSGKPQTFEEMLERQLSRQGGNNNEMPLNPSAPTPPLAKQAEASSRDGTRRNLYDYMMDDEEDVHQREGESFEDSPQKLPRSFSPASTSSSSSLQQLEQFVEENKEQGNNSTGFNRRSAAKQALKEVRSAQNSSTELLKRELFADTETFDDDDDDDNDRDPEKKHAEEEGEYKGTVEDSFNVPTDAQSLIKRAKEVQESLVSFQDEEVWGDDWGSEHEEEAGDDESALEVAVLTAVYANQRQDDEQEQEEQEEQRETEHEHEHEHEVELHTAVPSHNTHGDRGDVQGLTQTQTQAQVQAQAQAQMHAPPSSLVQSFFQPNRPAERAKPARSAKKAGGTGRAPDSSSSSAASGRGVEMRVSATESALVEKLRELDAEVTQYKAQSAALMKQRTKEHSENLRCRQQLEKAREAFQQEQEEWTKKRSEDSKRLKRMRIEVERRERKVNQIPDRSERDAIEALRTELVQVTEAFKTKESRLKMTVTRLKSQVAALAEENKDMQEEVRVAEAARIEEWHAREKKWRMSGSSKSAKAAAFTSRRRPVAASSSSSSSSSSSVSALAANQGKPTAAATAASKKASRGAVAATKATAVSVSARRVDVDQEEEVTSDEMVDSPIGGDTHSHGLNWFSEFEGSSGQENHQNDDQHHQATANQTATVNADAKAPSNYLLSSPSTTPASTSASAPLSLSSSSVPRSSSSYSPPMRGGDPAGVDGLAADVYVVSEVNHGTEKVERKYNDGSTLIVFHNGTTKFTAPPNQRGKSYQRVNFPNGDRKENFPDGRVVYFYCSAKTTHITFTDGIQVYHFDDKQTEKHFPDGSKEIVYADQTVKYIYANGGQRTVFPDGTVEEAL